MEGECTASECSLLCNDLLRAGRSRFLIDPGVRLAYQWREAQVLGQDVRVGLNGSSWAQVFTGSRPQFQIFRAVRQSASACSGRSTKSQLRA